MTKKFSVFVSFLVLQGKKKLSKKEKARLEAEQAESLRIEMEKERLRKIEEDRERKMRERRDAKKKQEQEAVENKLRRVQLRESSRIIKSIWLCDVLKYRFIKFFEF